jgi:hypothetical protein
MSPSIAPIASHCGIVSIKMRPARAIIREDAGLRSSIPYISAFSNEGLASMTFGIMTSPSAAEAWRSRSVERRRVAVMGVDGVLLEESALRLRAIWSSPHSRAM